MKALRSVPFIVVVLVIFTCPVFAIEINQGDYVQLTATNPAGVPLHRESRSSMFARLPDDSTAQVLQVTSTNWLQVSQDGQSGWIIKKYVKKVVDQPPLTEPTDMNSDDRRKVWGSSDQCESVVSLGRRLPRPPNTLRLISWGIRFFPQGSLKGDNPDHFTDFPWLSCALAWLDPDIVAVQEVLTFGEAQSAMQSVLDGLEGWNGGNWRVDMQECGDGHSQHVGFIYNADRVSLSEMRDLWQFNGKTEDSGDPCEGNLRPGRYAYVQSANGGFDFHLICVHTDSGKNDADLANRNTAIDRIDSVSASLIATDKDIVIIGDFNTMGASNLTAAQELQAFSAKVDSESPGFDDIPLSPQCTEYYDHHGGWLDHILVTDDTQELTRRAAVVEGYCTLANCESLEDMPPAYETLSDHCPLVIDFLDQDID